MKAIRNACRLLLPVFFILMVFSCQKKVKKDEFRIEGFLKGGEGKMLLLSEITPQEVLFIDTVYLDKQGEFTYTYKMPYKSFYLLETEAKEFITLLPNYGECIELTGQYDSLSLTYEVQGSPESSFLWELNHKELEGIQRLNKLLKQLSEVGDQDELKKKQPFFDSIYYDIYVDQESYYAQFIQEHKNSLSVLMALYKTFNKKKLFTVKKTPDLYQLISDHLRENMPDNPHTLQFLKTYQRQEGWNKKQEAI